MLRFELLGQRKGTLIVAAIVVVGIGGLCAVAWSKPSWTDSMQVASVQFDGRCVDRLEAAPGRERQSHEWTVRMMMSEAQSKFEYRGWHFRVLIDPPSEALFKSGPDADLITREPDWTVLGVWPDDPAFRPPGTGETDWPSVRRVILMRPASVFAKLHQAIFDVGVIKGTEVKRVVVDFPGDSSR